MASCEERIQPSGSDDEELRRQAAELLRQGFVEEAALIMEPRVRRSIRQWQEGDVTDITPSDFKSATAPVRRKNLPPAPGGFTRGL